MSDAWSLGILNHEMWTLYKAFVASKPFPLPDIPIQYSDFTVWQRYCLEQKLLDSQLTYLETARRHSSS